MQMMDLHPSILPSSEGWIGHSITGQPQAARTYDEPIFNLAQSGHVRSAQQDNVGLHVTEKFLQPRLGHSDKHLRFGLCVIWRQTGEKKAGASDLNA
jgi:hypothetical protein